MDNRSRLPRAVSNPSIRPCSASSYSKPTIPSRLPAPSRISRQASSSQLGSVSSVSPSPSPQDWTPTPTGGALCPQSNKNAFRTLVSRSPAKRLQPTRSTATLPQSTQPKASPPRIMGNISTKVKPLGPKRTDNTKRDLQRLQIEKDNDIHVLRVEKDEEIDILNGRIDSLERRVSELEEEQMAFAWRVVVREGERLLNEIREKREMIQKMREDNI